MSKARTTNELRKISKRKKVKRDPMQTERTPLVLPNTLPPPKVNQNFVKALQGHVNPFSEAALGCKVHDATSSKTFTYRTINRTGFNSVAAVTPAAGYTIHSSIATGEIVNWTTPANSTGAWSSSSDKANPSYTMLNTNATSVRIVSWGVRLYCTSPYTLTDGVVIMATNRGDLGTPTNATIMDPSAWMDYAVVPLKDLDHVWTAKRADATIAEQFNTITDASTASSASGWTSLCVFLCPSSGAGGSTASGTAFSIEVIKNYELVPKLSTVAMGLSTPPAPSSPTLNSAVDAHHSSTPHVMSRSAHSDLMDKVKSMGSQALLMGADIFAPRIANMARQFMYGGQRQRMLSGPIMEVD